MKSQLPIIFAIVLFISFYGCTSYNISKYSTDKSIERKLPPLRFEKIFVDNASKKYDTMVDQLRKEGYTVTIKKNFVEDETMWKLNITNSIIDTIHKGNIDIEVWLVRFNNRKSDTFDLINKEINNICEPYTNRFYGKAVCEIESKDNSGSLLLFLPSVLTAFIPNLFGFPIASQSSEVELKLEIHNQVDSCIAKYSTTGAGTAYCAMYWGYSLVGAKIVGDDKDISRAAHSCAVANALEKIKQQINKEAPLLKECLLNSFKN